MSGPDPFLVGNGAWCSACFPKGPPRGRLGGQGRNWRAYVRHGCNECAGAGRIAFRAEEIVASALAGKAWHAHDGRRSP